MGTCTHLRIGNLQIRLSGLPEQRRGECPHLRRNQLFPVYEIRHSTARTYEDCEACTAGAVHRQGMAQVHQMKPSLQVRLTSLLRVARVDARGAVLIHEMNFIGLLHVALLHSR